ncbi:PCL10 (YGL134W) and PCL8 (YPL219W) [Zygosaccharomyces parabailii]|nr:PCL10 (YGL134W) and PCL8 (YPL219W) [Zygosaccharomyces parabailii]CDH14867.1 uncharacterized protein ZBAI_06653 [Zygosaccharomyces bailii ISA1307]
MMKTEKLSQERFATKASKVTDQRPGEPPPVEIDLTKMYRVGVVSGSVSEFSDMEEDDDDTFELPIKASHSRSNNFSALTDDSGSLRSYSSNNVDKKVRFEAGDNSSDNLPKHNDGPDVVSRSRSDSLKSRRKVEELLHYANQVNEYLAVNLEKIDLFRSEILDGGLPNKSISNETTATPTISGSVSNFDLSESEIEEVKSGRSTNSELCSNSNMSDVSLLRTSPTSQEQSESFDLDSSSGEAEEHDVASLYLRHDKHTEFASLAQVIRHNSSMNSEKTVTNEMDESSGKGSLIMGRDGLSDVLSDELTQEEALKVFQETIEFILIMSQRDDYGKTTDESSIDRTLNYSQFIMKSLPTLSYQDLIHRIHSKCVYSPVVYLASAYLFQVLCLTRKEPKGFLCLKHCLQETEVHRLLIACVRVATKITEDYVHSHQYFCKVCGISRRLLSRLEVSLVTCLKNDCFMMTSKKLGASPLIRDELKAWKDEHS